MADYVTSGYTKHFVRPESLRATIESCVTYLEHNKLTHAFDTIAFRGMSGAIVAPSVAMRLSKEVIMVRKPGESAHSSYNVEGNREARRVLIVDDFVNSGNTVRIIAEAVKTFVSESSVLGSVRIIGCLEYRNLDEYPYDANTGYLFNVEELLI